MMKMNYWWMSSLIVLHVVHNVSGSASIIFNSGIAYDPICGLKHNEDFWNTTGTFTSTDANVNIVFRVGANEDEICRIDLTNCALGQSINCFCTSSSPGSAGNIYGLFVKYLANARLSGETLKVTYTGRNDPTLRGDVVIGRLPFMFRDAVATYKIGGGNEENLQANQTVQSNSKSNVTLTFCVTNLLSNTMKIDNVDKIPTSGCVSEIFKPSKTVIFSYTETVGCRRSQSFTFNLEAGSASGSDGISGGAIAGIIIGVLAAVAAVAGGVWWFTHKKSSNDSSGGRKEGNSTAKSAEAGTIQAK